MWQTGFSSRVVNENKKINGNKLVPKNVPPNLMDIDKDKGKGRCAKGRVDETRDRGKPLQAKQKGCDGRNRPIPVNKKATRLTGHFSAIHLKIQGSGYQVISWQRFGQTSILYGAALL